MTRYEYSLVDKKAVDLTVDIKTQGRAFQKRHQENRNENKNSGFVFLRRRLCHVHGYCPGKS
ncbi:MAG: hypothetical protein COX19_08205 [Desulfobacterales bacterium CG23_combo_of_CG06-09_8_20_14_all_51_8]|nr:MAG: hypothetical protein COX19_08205 [Desulfobacterales bacterium CG23_combo_of_CG06-09_8_20_14_all_51_8]